MNMSMYETFGFSKSAADSEFSKITIKRNVPGDDDVQFQVTYCGICHTDVHLAHNDLGSTRYPIIPGHELAGVVTAVGKNVKDVRIGDNVGVGCISDSCMECSSCQVGEEQACVNGMTMTYNEPINHGHIATDSGYTYGGYSGSQTVNRRFLVKIPDNFPLAAAGPVFCAGVTMYSPLVHWGAAEGGRRVGVVGIGGLGQFGVRLAAAMGNTVTAISTSPHKQAVAGEMGATRFVVSTSEESMRSAAGSLDLILNTVSSPHQVGHYLPLLARDGVIVQLGLVTDQHQVSQMPLVYNRQSIAGSCIGGMRDTQRCIDFCQQHDIVPKTEIITADQLSEVYKILRTKNDRVVRYVLDIANSKK